MYFFLPETHKTVSIFPAKYPLQNSSLGAPSEYTDRSSLLRSQGACPHGTADCHQMTLCRGVLCFYSLSEHVNRDA